MINLILIMLTSTCDVPQNWQVNIQDPASPSLEGMITFHEYLMFFLLQIGVAICWYLWKNKQNVKIFLFTHDSTLEVYWTVLPAFILLFIAVPSFILLYSLDDVVNPNLTIKVTGHQWFWSYEYGDACIRRNELLLANLSFDSYLVSTADLIAGQLRLLEVDQRLIIPTNTHVRLLICSGDVLHSWAVPSLGIKLDACPGRVSEANLFIKRPGVYYGQCSEICGTNHGFMPIVVRAVPYVDFMNWWMAREANLASSQKGLSQAVLSNLWLDTVSVESDSSISAVATLFSFKNCKSLFLKAKTKTSACFIILKGAWLACTPYIVANLYLLYESVYVLLHTPEKYKLATGWKADLRFIWDRIVFLWGQKNFSLYFLSLNPEVWVIIGTIFIAIGVFNLVVLSLEDIVFYLSSREPIVHPIPLLEEVNVSEVEKPKDLSNANPTPQQKIADKPTKLFTWTDLAVSGGMFAFGGYHLTKILILLFL